MVSSLILFEQVKTTAPKAKALKSEMESLIFKLKAMDNEVNAKRYLASTLYGGAKEKAYDFRNSYTCVKLYKLDRRLGDGAQEVIVRLEKAQEAKPEERKPSAVKAKKENKK